MDSRTFAKMMGDCRVIDKIFTSGDCDIVFQKVKFAVANAPSEGAYTASSQATKINFDHFSRIALLSVAEKKNMSMSALVRGMAQCSGPIVHGTTPDAVRFHDDTNTYPTGSLAASRTLEHAGAGELSPQKSTEVITYGFLTLPGHNLILPLCLQGNQSNGSKNCEARFSGQEKLI